jgi:hypothetical protein
MRNGRCQCTARRLNTSQHVRGRCSRCHSRHNVAIIESRGHYDRRWSWRCNQSLHRARARLVRPGTVRIHPHFHRNVMAIRRYQSSLFVPSARNLIIDPYVAHTPALSVSASYTPGTDLPPLPCDTNPNTCAASCRSLWTSSP